MWSPVYSHIPHYFIPVTFSIKISLLKKQKDDMGVMRGPCTSLLLHVCGFSNSIDPAEEGQCSADALWLV